MEWKPKLYLQFERERTQPSIDLAARIDMDAPRRVLDIGCGPGNSTRVLKDRWPSAAVVGLDRSEAMLAEARARHTDIEWRLGDAAGDLSALGAFDVVFSNAAIQWMPDHGALLRNWYALLNPGGVLAVQAPYTVFMAVDTELRALAAEPRWSPYLERIGDPYEQHPPAFYYDVLSGLAGRFELWQTDYYHVMDGHAAIVEWYGGSGLRPYTGALTGEDQRTAFLAEYEGRLRAAYPAQADGKVLFPFTRIFFTALRGQRG